MKTLANTTAIRMSTRGDFDGNGVSDIFLYWADSGAWYLCRNTGGDFEYVRGQWDARQQLKVADLNGDGRKDLFCYNPATGDWALLRLQRDYRPRKLYVTENGAAYTDAADAAGGIADERRIAYLRGHLAAARRAIAEGGIYLNNHRVADEKQCAGMGEVIDGQFIVLRKGRKNYHLVKVI